jgi:hypothetical protein
MDRAPPPLPNKRLHPPILGQSPGTTPAQPTCSPVRRNGAATADRSRREGSGNHEPRRRAQRRKRRSPGRRREPAIGTHQVPPAPRRRRQSQPQRCAHQRRLREATERDQLAINRRPGPSHQRQRTTGRCPDNHRCSTLLAAIGPAAPRGLGPLNQHDSQHHGENTRHSQPATDTTHPARRYPTQHQPRPSRPTRGLARLCWFQRVAGSAATPVCPEARALTLKAIR